MTDYREKKSALTKDEMWEDDGILVPTQLNSSETWKSKRNEIQNEKIKTQSWNSGTSTVLQNTK